MTSGLWTLVFSFGMLAAGAQAAPCDLKAYKPVDGLTAQAAGDGAILIWHGEGGAQLRAQFAIRDGKPWVSELAVQEQGGPG